MGLGDVLKEKIPFLKKREEDIVDNSSLDSLKSSDSSLSSPGTSDIPDALSETRSDPFSSGSNESFSANRMGFDSQKNSGLQSTENNNNNSISQELLIAKVDSMKAKIEVLEHKIDKILELLKNAY